MLKKVKSRPDKLFIILSPSDMGVGVFTVPLPSLLTFPLNHNFICFLYKGLNFFAYYPFLFFLHYGDCNCNRQRLNDPKIQNLWKIYYNSSFTHCSWIYLCNNYLCFMYFLSNDPEFYVHQIVQVILQCLFLLTIVALYSYLLFYVHRKTRKFDNHIKGTTDTVTVIS